MAIDKSDWALQARAVRIMWPFPAPPPLSLAHRAYAWSLADGAAAAAADGATVSTDADVREEGVRGRKYAVRPSLPPPRPASLLLFGATKFHPGWPGREKGGRKSEEEEDAKEVLLPDCRTTHARQGNSVFSDVFCPFPSLRISLCETAT